MINPEQKKQLRKLKRMLGKLEEMACNHCGHETLVWRMYDYEERILGFVRDEVMVNGGGQ